MKKMIIMAAVLLAACECGWAEDGFFSTKKSEEQVSVEFRGGLSVSQMAAVDDGASNKGYRRLGYNASAVIDIPVWVSLGFQTGVTFAQKGMNEEALVMGAMTKTKSNPGYLEIPLLASYRHAFKEKVQLQVNAGPFLAMGVCGKFKTKQQDALGNWQPTGEMDWFGGKNDIQTAQFKRFDMGWHIGARLKFNDRVSLGYSYEAGFVDTARNLGYKVKTRSHAVNLGLCF